MNATVVSYFILLGFSDLYQLQNVVLFALLLAYVTCVLGNVSVIALVQTHPSLHTPMYFFISKFSLLEIMFVSVTIPNLLVNLISDSNTISFIGCFTQMYVFISLGLTECCFLTVMVYDRHVAINSPLHYAKVMNHNLCIRLAVLPCIIGFGSTVIPVSFTSKLSFCGHNVINHFFCDLIPLQQMSCSNSFSSVVSTGIVCLFDSVFPFLIIMGLYTNIIITVTKIKSNKGKQKAFSTCSSHLIVVSLFFGSGIVVYMNPMIADYDKYLALLYATFTPMINPFIYTFRNRDVKNAFRNMVNIQL